MCKKIVNNRIYSLCIKSYKLIYNVVNRNYRKCLHSRGRRYKFGPHKMLEIFLKKIRYNDPFERIANEYNISKSSINKIFYKFTRFGSIH